MRSESQRVMDEARGDPEGLKRQQAYATYSFRRDRANERTPAQDRVDDIVAWILGEQNRFNDGCVRTLAVIHDQIATERLVNNFPFSLMPFEPVTFPIDVSMGSKWHATTMDPSFYEWSIVTTPAMPKQEMEKTVQFFNTNLQSY